MEEKQLRSMQLFRLMTGCAGRGRFTKTREISKSQFGTLLALRHGGKDLEDKECRNRDPFDDDLIGVGKNNESEYAGTESAHQQAGEMGYAGCPTRRTVGHSQLSDTRRKSLLTVRFQNPSQQDDFIMEQLGEEDTRIDLSCA